MNCDRSATRVGPGQRPDPVQTQRRRNPPWVRASGHLDRAAEAGAQESRSDIRALQLLREVQAAGAVRTRVERAREWNYWSGKGSFGLTVRAGNTEQAEYNAQAHLQRRTPATRLSFDYIGNVSTLSLELSKRFDLDVSFVWDRIANPKVGADGVQPRPDDFRLVVALGVVF